MPAALNRATIIGNLGADPDMRYTASGKGVCELRVATNESWKDRDGNKQEATEWHRVIVWGAHGEACAKHLAKGRQVYVEGRIKTRKWEDKEGNARYTTEIVASNVQFLSGGGERGGRDEPPPPSDDYPAGQGPDDNIPF